MSSPGCLLTGHSGYPTRRKVVNPKGQLGSLYDIQSDRLIDQYSVPSHQTKTFRNKRVICRLISAQKSKRPSSYLELIGFHSDLIHNLDTEMIVPTGVSRLIEYSRPINNRTRFLYFCYRQRQEKIQVGSQRAARIIAPPQPGSTKATHAITKIIWGVEFIIVIAIPPNSPVEPFDQCLRRLQSYLQRWNEPIRLTKEENRLLSTLTNTAVYGTETCIDNLMISISTILASVRDWQRKPEFLQPVEYIMQPLRWLYGDPQFQVRPHAKPADQHLKRIPTLLARIDGQIEDLGQIFEQLPTAFPSGTLNQNLHHERQNYQYLLDAQENLKNRLKKVEIDVRQERLPSSDIDAVIAHKDFQCLNQERIVKNHQIAERLLSKMKLIEQLNKIRIEYVNAVDIYPNAKANHSTFDQVDRAMRQHFSNPNCDFLLWYAGDRLRREQNDRWEQHYQKMISERSKSTQGRQLELIYVDFSDVTPTLKQLDMIRLPMRASSPQRPVRIPREITPPPPPPPEHHPIPKPRPQPQPPLPHPNPSTEINVLILGETGVGKSTFINAFVNYLSFDTFQQAERDEPIALIPVSFITTINDQFDEFTVQFGSPNVNEFHNEDGQSVTQHCRSYVFDIDSRTRLRLIDTPGVGDTRGTEQDRQHIDHILSYANNYSYINAICLLFKPNSSRLNIMFRYCIHELFTLFPTNIHSQIFFCFTNTRSTFYAPGDTGPLIKQMLQQEKLTTIPFEKRNIFCFDSESFRYLIAKRVGVEMDPDLHSEFQQSWEKSVIESKRLQNMISSMKPIYFHRALTLRQLSYEIIKLARPLMETLRLIIYNWKLREANIISHQINIISNPMTIDLCTQCAESDIININPCWISQYRIPHSDDFHHHPHRRCTNNNKHFLLECLVEHDETPLPAGLSNERWESSLQNFLFKCDQLAYFLIQHGSPAEEDPFARVLNRFIDEEKTIINAQHLQTRMNQRVSEALLGLRNSRQENYRRLNASNEQLSMESVKRIIEELTRLDTVKRLIDSVNETRRLKMNAYELRINTDQIRNRNTRRIFEVSV